MKKVVSFLLISLMFLASCGLEREWLEGPQGSYGTQGVAGPTGATGATGPQGAPGASCTVSAVAASNVAPNGGSLISCPDGSQSLVLNGTNGTNGAAGTPGTIVTPVQFCAGTPSYPSSFPEVGFCIDNTLYAVYSANDGFLTEVTPGEYRSNAVGPSCNFYVGPNCQVSR